MAIVTIPREALTRDQIRSVCENGAYAAISILATGTAFIAAKTAVTVLTGKPNAFGFSIGLSIGLAEVYGSRWIARNVDKIDLRVMTQGIAMGQLCAYGLCGLSFAPEVAFVTGAIVGASIAGSHLRSKILTSQ